VRPAIVNVLLLAGPVVGATVNETVPFPLAEVPPPSAIHVALLAALHPQAADVDVTATVLEPPALPIEYDSGLMPKRQPLAWVIVNACSPTVTVAVRGGPSDAATLNVTVPGPVPDPPAVIATQVASVRADHEHVAPVVTLTDPEPPLAFIVSAGGVMPIVHPSPWRTITRWPAIVMAPLREGPVVARAS
jgi:hypothetical protein